MNQLSREQVNQVITLVKQKLYFLHEKPIIFNLLFYLEPEVFSDDDLLIAFKKNTFAEIHDFIQGNPRYILLYERIRKIMLDCGLSEAILQKESSLLSGGQEKLFACVIALMRNSPVMLFDEVTNGLDRDLKTRIIQKIYSFRSEKIIIIITHNPENFNFPEVRFLVLDEQRFHDYDPQARMIHNNNLVPYNLDNEPNRRHKILQQRGMQIAADVDGNSHIKKIRDFCYQNRYSLLISGALLGLSCLRRYASDSSSTDDILGNSLC